MDKKSKKKIDVLRSQIANLQKLLSGAKSQNDDPSEVTRLQKEIAALQEQIAKINAKA